MDWLQALLLGLVQGLTEFLPVSSSGHLALARHSGLMGLLWFVLAASFAFTSCSKDLLEDIVYPDRDYFGWTLEFEVNGEKIVRERIFDNQGRLGLLKNHWPDYGIFQLSRYMRYYSGYNVLTKPYVFDYSKLAFNMLHDGLYLHIVGPGQGGFKKNVVYSSPNDIVLYHPALLTEFANKVLNPHIVNDWDIIPTFNGYEVKVLSSSFKFNHSIKWGVGKVLNFYFEFEEVITAVPEGWIGTPTVGDTLRVTRGHLVHIFVDTDEAAIE